MGSISKNVSVMFKYACKITFVFLLASASRLAVGQVTAGFDFFTPGDSCNSRTVQFDASISTGDIASYTWAFKNSTSGGDVEVGAGKVITKNFLSPGLYEASLTVAGRKGQTSVKTKQIRVYKSPTVDFMVNVKEGCQPLSVTFKDKSTAGDGTIVRWEWNYNDGKKDILNTSDSVVNLYSNSGVYSPTLIVTNSAGCTKSLNQANLISVYDKITPSFNVTNNYSCQAPHTVNFENTSSKGPFHFTWDFGDGSTLPSDEHVVTHMYTKFGTYSIKLASSNAPKNCTSATQSTLTQNVYIGKPSATFGIPASICAGNSLTIVPQNDASNVTNAGKWYFEDNHSVSLGTSVTHTFSTVGTWKIRYVAYNTFSGCASDTITKSIQVLTSPTASFSVDKTAGCQVPFNIKINNASLNAVKYDWDFGDGTTSSMTSGGMFSKSYTSFGSFAVSLKATSNNGCVSTQRVTLSNKPLALDFAYSPKEGCIPLNVSMGANIPSGSAFVFDFGNGKVVNTTANTASAQYTAPGSYSIKVSVKTPDGCVGESSAKIVKVNAFCDTDGDTTGLKGARTNTIYVVRQMACDKKYSFSFEDTTKNATVISWDFDGTTINSSQNPISYTFPQNGKKKFIVTVKLKENGSGDEIEHKIRVDIVDEKAAFLSDKTSICKNIPINFKTLGIDSSHIVRYIWDFGDSTRQTIENYAYFAASGSYLRGDVSHTYKRFGLFYPKLLLLDKFGCKDSVAYPAPIRVQSPAAQISMDKASFCGDSALVTFRSQKDSLHSGAIKEWKWDFGDNTGATYFRDTLVRHVYKNSDFVKKFNVKLSITDSSGCSDEQDTTLVSYVPQANFTTDDTLRCGKFDIRFTNTSKAQISDTTQYVWMYGNGKTDTRRSGTVTYADTGHYTVSLIVKDDGGCSDTMTKKDYVKLVRPKASFTIGGDTSKCIGTFSLPFQSNSLYGKEYIWDFGDSSGTVTDKSEVSHFYKTAGAFTVKLSVLGLDGCTDSTQKTIRIKGSSEELNVKDYYVCKGEAFTAVVNGKNIKSYFWDFGDLSSTSQLTKSDSVTHYYVHPGEYHPNVILVSPEGCQSTVTLSQPVLVDSLSAGPDVNIECGDTSTMLKGRAALMLSGKYVWHGPDSAQFVPDSTSLTAKVNRPGQYVLRSKDQQCSMTDTLLVTFSGFIPTVDAGADRLQDCISGDAHLTGSTSSPNTILQWSGPAGAVFYPNDTVVSPVVNLQGTYVLHAKHEKCDNIDTVRVIPCSLHVKDSTVRICASFTGEPPQRKGFSLLALDSFVTAGISARVKWYNEKTFATEINTSDSVLVADGDTLYAKIISPDSSQTARAAILFQVDSLPNAPKIEAVTALCEGSNGDVKVAGHSKSRYTWVLQADTNLKVVLSAKDSVQFVAGSHSISGKVVETDDRGCTGDTAHFTIPIDLRPTKATVNGQVTDTVRSCIATKEKTLGGNIPQIGKGHWQVLKNTDSASIELDQPNSLVKGFAEMSDTLVVKWEIENGACPSSSAVLTLLPEQALTPTVSLQQVPVVCEGTEVVFHAVPGNAPGSHPTYSFYDGKNTLLRREDTATTLHLIATHDSSVYVRIHSSYPCVYADQAISNKVALEVVNKPTAHILHTTDTLCVLNGPVVLTSLTDPVAGSVYEWYHLDSLKIRSTKVQTLSFSEPSESGTYTLKVSNSYCPPSYDNVTIKIYEKPEISFSSEMMDVMYAAGKTVELPFEIKPLLFPSDISAIDWHPTDYLGYYKQGGTTLYDLDQDSLVQRPVYRAQEKEIATTYWVTVRTGALGKGCESSASILVNNYVQVKIPNAFSPNGDGLNDTWIIDGMSKYPRSRVIVFNRWGNSIFQDVNGYRVPWDGYIGGQKVALGTYYYVIEFTGSHDGSDHMLQGAITIVD